MATVLVAWELGGGLGHLTTLKPIVRGLLDRGHRVVAVVQDVVRARCVLRHRDIVLLQAPTATVPDHARIKLMRSFAHILHNSGFGDGVSLTALLHSWRALLDLVRPDMVLFDHSPLALLAARGHSARRITIGTGFCCPPAESPFRDLRPEVPAHAGQLAEEESRLLKTVNAALDSLGLPRLQHLSDLYRDVDGSILTTFAELDHYAGRPNADYYGTWSEGGGQDIKWPKAKGKRIFAYLNPFPGFPALVNKLLASGYPTVFYAKGLTPSLRKRLSSPTVQFVSEEVDLAQVGQSCDVAILNGGHGTTASMLLAGKPTLQIPLYLEQSMTAQAVARMQAGLAVSGKDAHGIEAALDNLLSCEDYTLGACRFAEKYVSHRGEVAVRRALDLCDRLMPSDLGSEDKYHQPKQPPEKDPSDDRKLIFASSSQLAFR